MKKTKLLHCGKLFDGIHDQLRSNVDILVEGEFIKEVGRNLPITSDVAEIDLSTLTVTPGMIDAHIHSDILDWRTFWQNIPYFSDAHTTLVHLHTAQRCLERGFTTIRSHPTNPNFTTVDVKNLIDKGVFPGARMHVACRLLGTPGSHIDNGQSYRGNPMAGLKLQACNIGTGPDFFRNAVRNDVKYGADFVKLFLSGGFSTPNDGPEDQQMEDDEIEAFITTANALHCPSTAHVYAPVLMQKLIKYGITGMEHGSLMDEETAQLFEKTDTYLVPTFCPYDDIIAGDEDSLAKKSPAFRKKLRYYGEWLKEGRKVIINSNICLGYGTDLVAVHQCYESWHKYASWLNSGMDPYRALKAATSVNARILNMSDKIGTIEPGKYADISAWHRNLLKDPNALSECDFVMKGGTVYSSVYSVD